MQDVAHGEACPGGARRARRAWLHGRGLCGAGWAVVIGLWALPMGVLLAQGSEVVEAVEELAIEEGEGLEADGLEKPGEDCDAAEGVNGAAVGVMAKRGQYPFLLPSPPEYLLALRNNALPRWRQFYRPPLRVVQADRQKTAFGLGTILADAFLATEARDEQQLRNLGQDLTTFCNALATVDDGLMGHLQEQYRWANQRDWDGVRGAVQQLSLSISESLERLRDPDLARLVEVGMWWRLWEVGSRAMREHEEGGGDGGGRAVCVGGPALTGLLYQLLREIDGPPAETAFVSELRDELARIAIRWRGLSRPVDESDLEPTEVKLRNFMRRSFAE